MKAAAHRGAYRDTFLLWKSSLKNLTDTKLESKTAVSLSLDLFNFLYRTVCKIQIFSRIYFCNPRLCFVIKRKMKELLETNGGRNVPKIFSVCLFVCFFEGVSFQLGYIESVLSCLHLLK